MVHLEDEEERRIATPSPDIRLIVGGQNHDALGPIWLDKTLVAKTEYPDVMSGGWISTFRTRSSRTLKAG
jgi:hypothetical protein